MLLKALNIITHVWYLTLLGKENQFNSENICSDGVIKSTLRIILAARFCNLTRRFVLKAVHKVMW